VTRYFFNYRDPGRYFIDTEGTMLADLVAARAEGRLSAREILGCEHGELDPQFLPGRFEITDVAGEILAMIPFDESRTD
jgi:hypothetical protein